MGYKSKADGPVVKKGKTRVEVFPDDGKHIIDKGPKANKSSINSNMKKYGTNIARIMNQKSSGRGR